MHAVAAWLVGRAAGESNLKLETMRDLFSEWRKTNPASACTALDDSDWDFSESGTSELASVFEERW